MSLHNFAAKSPRLKGSSNSRGLILDIGPTLQHARLMLDELWEYVDKDCDSHDKTSTNKEKDVCEKKRQYLLPGNQERKRQIKDSEVFSWPKIFRITVRNDLKAMDEWLAMLSTRILSQNLEISEQPESEKPGKLEETFLGMNKKSSDGGITKAFTSTIKKIRETPDFELDSFTTTGDGDKAIPKQRKSSISNPISREINMMNSIKVNKLDPPKFPEILLTFNPVTKDVASAASQEPTNPEYEQGNDALAVITGLRREEKQKALEDEIIIQLVIFQKEENIGNDDDTDSYSKNTSSLTEIVSLGKCTQYIPLNATKENLSVIVSTMNRLVC